MSLATPILALLAAFISKFKRSIPARFFLINNPKPREAKFHFHACSLGEVCAIESLFCALKDARISVITQTSFNKAHQISPNTSFLPFECFLPFWFSKCRVLVVFEAELWLNLFRAAKYKGAKTVLLNARISDKSYASYLRFKFYYKAVFSAIDLVLAQSELDKVRLQSLGAKNIKVVGNIKSANLARTTKIYEKPAKRVITIASSHEGEEKNILDRLKITSKDKLFIAPRHPERFDKIDILAREFAANSHLSYERFSQNLGLKSDIILIDVLGELVNIYAISDIVVLCGSFEPNIGGHNPIEAAQFGCKIISGKYFHNQKSLYSTTENITICEYDEIYANFNVAKNTKIKDICNFDEVLREIKKLSDEK